MAPEQDRLVFITGASSGIGQAAALRFYQAGYRLALVARRTDELNAWIKQAAMEPHRVRVYAADVSITQSIVDAGLACITLQGVPDVVVASAGVSIGMDTMDRADLDVMARVYATNNIGLAATFHPFLKVMVRRGSGVLVGIASVNGIRGFPGHGAYCSSKAAVISYCESLRGELRASGVKVLTISPGYVDTPLTRGNGYSMPFLMSPQAFAQKLFRAVATGSSYRTFPWQMAVVGKLLRVLPNLWFDRLFSRRARKRRRTPG